MKSSRNPLTGAWNRSGGAVSGIAASRRRSASSLRFRKRGDSTSTASRTPCRARSAGSSAAEASSLTKSHRFSKKSCGVCSGRKNRSEITTSGFIARRVPVRRAVSSVTPASARRPKSSMASENPSASAGTSRKRRPHRTARPGPSAASNC